MIVDSSAIVAILLQEEDAAVFAEAIEQATVCGLSIANYLEISIVAQRLTGTRPRSHPESQLGSHLDQIFDAGAVTLEPVTVEQGRIAADAYRRFGRGSGHAACLNFGDCFAYALAKATGEPLLFKGGDFAQTDAAPALPSTA